MKSFLALLKVSFLGLLLNTMGGGRRSSRSGKPRSASGLPALIIICVVMLYISGVYSSMLAGSLGPSGGLDLMLALMLLISLLLPLVFTLYSAQGTIFSTKDVDLVLSLPVSAFKVMLSRILALYLETALIVEMILIPPGVLWLMNGGHGGVLFFVLLLLQGLFIALIPSLITLVFGFLISLLISRIRFRNLFNIIFSVIIFIGIMTLGFNFGNGTAMLAADPAGIRRSLFGALPPLGWMVDGPTGPNPLHFLFVILLCVVPFLVVSWLLSLLYKGLLTRLSGHYLRSNFKVGEMGVSGSFAALLKKEGKKFISSPSLFLNSGIGALLAVILAVLALVFKRELQSYIQVFASAGGASGQLLEGLYLPAIFLGVILFLLLCIYPSAVSISLEGKNLWILKEAPVDTAHIFAAKAGFNFFLGAGVSVIMVLAGGAALGLSPPILLAILPVSLLFAAFIAMNGLMINLRMPRLDVDNETVLVKQSGSVLVSMLLNFLAVAVLVGLVFLLNFLGLSFPLIMLAEVILLLIVDLLLLRQLNTRGRWLFAQL